MSTPTASRPNRAPHHNGVDLLANPEAERAVLASQMRNPDARHLIQLNIHADLFTREATREALVAIPRLETS